MLFRKLKGGAEVRQHPSGSRYDPFVSFGPSLAHDVLEIESHRLSRSLFPAQIFARSKSRSKKCPCKESRLTNVLLLV